MDYHFINYSNHFLINFVLFVCIYCSIVYCFYFILFYNNQVVKNYSVRLEWGINTPRVLGRLFLDPLLKKESKDLPIQDQNRY